MDPHRREEMDDGEGEEQDGGGLYHHRRLRQRSPPASPSSLYPRRKRLVNFKFSSRKKDGRGRADSDSSEGKSDNTSLTSEGVIPMREMGGKERRQGKEGKERYGRNLNQRDSNSNCTEKIEEREEEMEEERDRDFEDSTEFQSTESRREHEGRSPMGARQAKYASSMSGNLRKSVDDRRNANLEQRRINNDPRDIRRDSRDLRNESVPLRETLEDRRDKQRDLRDSRTLEERRQDFHRIHERRHNLQPAKERRGGILHIRDDIHEENEEPESDTSSLPMNENLRSKNFSERQEHDPNGNMVESSSGEGSTLRRRGEDTTARPPPLGKRSHSTSSWDKVKGATISRAEDGASRLGSVVELVTSRRRSSLAPSIWTPSVPRSPPGPRPANFHDQEEPGRKAYTITFLSPSHAPNSGSLARQRSLRRPHRSSHTGQGATNPWAASGKRHLAWLQKLVDNPLLQDGQLLKGLEMGVKFPAVFLRAGQAEGAGGGGRRVMAGSLGPEYVLAQGVYEEVVTWAPELLVTCPSDPSLWTPCCIMLAFMTLDGDLDQKMEQQWKEWTGALYVYCNIDDDLGLKKLSFYRRRSPPKPNVFTYLVVVELDTVTSKNCLQLLDFVYRMRLKNMSGYISVYQVHQPEADVSMIPGGCPVPRSPPGSQSSVEYPGDLDLARMTL